MCGVAAVFAYDARAEPVSRCQMERIGNRMYCRGPDGGGVWFHEDGRVALGHRRLSIIDLTERGAQPMRSASTASVISFNGEIYNYRELRSELERKGYAFVSDSDTEVLLHLYEDRGEAMLESLRGMFAFALWDAQRGGLLLARDPFGIKPLYYADDGRTIRVASEVKALLAGGQVDTSPAPAGHVGFFLWGHVPEPYTLYRGVRALPAGSLLWVDGGGPTAARHYTSVTRLFSEAIADPASIEPCHATQRIRDALLDSVRMHLVADVDVGIFLSAGLDSASITGLAAEASGRLRTVTLGFEEYRGTERDEVPLAELVARHYGADHQTVWVTRADFRAELDHIVDRMDQPTIDGVNIFFVARSAARAGLKVAISGVGGDELFGGYRSFRSIPRLAHAIGTIPGSATLGRGLRVIAAPVLRGRAGPKYPGLVEYGGTVGGAYLLRRGLFMPWELTEVLDPVTVRAGWEELNSRGALGATVAGIASDRHKVSALEATWYMRNQLLRDADWASMSHSVEVRVPLVDGPLWRSVARLAGVTPTIGKCTMAAAVRPPLPAPLVARPKSGFSIPTREWLLEGEGARYAGRGLRGWARYIYEHFT